MHLIINASFEYEYWLAIQNHQTFAYLAKYPVFPWILRNYERDKLDLNDEDNYRNLSLPFGPQDKKGQLKCKKKYDISEEE